MGWLIAWWRRITHADLLAPLAALRVHQCAFCDMPLIDPTEYCPRCGL